MFFSISFFVVSFFIIFLCIRGVCTLGVCLIRFAFRFNRLGGATVCLCARLVFRHDESLFIATTLVIRPSALSRRAYLLIRRAHYFWLILYTHRSADCILCFRFNVLPALAIHSLSVIPSLPRNLLGRIPAELQHQSTASPTLLQKPFLRVLIIIFCIYFAINGTLTHKTTLLTAVFANCCFY